MDVNSQYKLYRMQYRLAPLYFLLPALILFSIFVIFPIGQSIWLSFHTWDGFGSATWGRTEELYQSVAG